MGELKFTPGPWVVDSENHGAWGVNFMVQQADNRLVDIAEMVSEPADAHLISAAPDMYEALKEAVGYIEAMLEDGCQHCGGDCSSANPPVQYCPMERIMKDLAKAKVAIAKADGKT